MMMLNDGGLMRRLGPRTAGSVKVGSRKPEDALTSGKGMASFVVHMIFMYVYSRYVQERKMFTSFVSILHSWRYFIYVLRTLYR